MKNSEVCKVFVNGANEGNGSNMRISNNRLYSYNTCICERFVNGRGQYNFIMNKTKYSVSTARHQYYLRYALRNENVVPANNVPKGANSLYIYVKNA